MLEVYVHIQRLDDLVKGKPVNVKVNYADQYDVKFMVDPKKYIIHISRENRNLLVIRKKKLKDYIFRKKSL